MRWRTSALGLQISQQLGIRRENRTEHGPTEATCPTGGASHPFGPFVLCSSKLGPGEMCRTHALRISLCLFWAPNAHIRQRKSAEQPPEQSEPKVHRPADSLRTNKI